MMTYFTIYHNKERQNCLISSILLYLDHSNIKSEAVFVCFLLGNIKSFPNINKCRYKSDFKHFFCKNFFLHNSTITRFTKILIKLLNMSSFLVKRLFSDTVVTSLNVHNHLLVNICVADYATELLETYSTIVVLVGE